MSHEIRQSFRSSTRVGQVEPRLPAVTRELSFDRIGTDRTLFGAVPESCAFCEVLRSMTASDMRPAPIHFRNRHDHEVEVVLKRDDGNDVVPFGG